MARQVQKAKATGARRKDADESGGEADRAGAERASKRARRTSTAASRFLADNP